MCGAGASPAFDGKVQVPQVRVRSVDADLE